VRRGDPLVGATLRYAPRAPHQREGRSGPANLLKNSTSKGDTFQGNTAILLMIGCFGYLIESFAAFLLPNYEVEIALFTFWGEVLLPLWLLIKGVNVEQWRSVTQ